ncbi:MAG: amidohydrolase family protein [Planctomycetota bacterium]|nr:amidohydrolase family protein [Planctomycetota bacterium]
MNFSHKITNSISVLLLVIVCGGSSAIFGSDPVPAPEQAGPIAIVGATIHPVDRAPIANGTILFDRGQIVAIGTNVQLPADCQIVEAQGKHVYPGLIAPATSLGLIEINSVRATNDQRETGTLNPNARAASSVNPDSEHIPVARANGIALAATRPSGGLISGQSALLRLDGWSWEDLAVTQSLGIEIQWPSMGRGRRFFEDEDAHSHGHGHGHSHDRAGTQTVDPRADDDPRSASRNARVEEIRELFNQAKIYCNNRPAGAKIADGDAPDLRLEGLRSAVEGTSPVFIHVDGAREIRAAVEWALGQELKPVICGGRDAPQVAAFLAERNVPVIYGPVHRLPSKRDSAYDEPFTGPATLANAGVEFCIGAFDTSNVRNLPYHAATAAAYGLGAEKALEAITLATARIFGVADKYGSLTRGKSATMIITDGDPLEIPTQVEAMWIDGRSIDLTSRHTRLRDKYAEKIRLNAQRRAF